MEDENTFKVHVGTPEYLWMVKQGSDDWHKKRLGIITASQINSILTPKGQPAKNQAMRDFACKLAAEREYDFIEDNYQSFDMLRGHFQEEIARDIYDETFDRVEQCGIIRTMINGVMVGASPDGLINKDGGIEIKSRAPKFQVKTILSGEVPDEYMNQIQTILLVSAREWLDFVQYSNGLPLFVKRVAIDEERQSLIVKAIVEFEKVVCEYREEFVKKSEPLVKTKRVEIKFEDDVLLGSEK